MIAVSFIAHRRYNFSLLLIINIDCPVGYNLNIRVKLYNMLIIMVVVLHKLNGMMVWK